MFVYLLDVLDLNLIDMSARGGQLWQDSSQKMEEKHGRAFMNFVGVARRLERWQEAEYAH